MSDEKIVDYQGVLRVKNFLTTANERIGELEHALYSILDTKRLDVIREIAADALNEDLEVYMEEELDFEDEWQPEEGFYDE